MHILNTICLGPRLLECCNAVLAWEGQRSAAEIFGTIDTIKLKSAMTLFERTAEVAAPFGEVLRAFFDGARDERTLALIARPPG